MGSVPGSGRFPGGGHGNLFLLPGQSHGQRMLVGYGPQGHKELETTEATQHAHKLALLVHSHLHHLITYCLLSHCKLLTYLMKFPKLSKLENIDYLSLYRKNVTDPERLYQISYIKVPGFRNIVIFQILRISLYEIIIFPNQFSSIAQSCPTLCDPIDCSTPSFPIHHQLQKNTVLQVVHTFYLFFHVDVKFSYKLYSSLQS